MGCCASTNNVPQPTKDSLISNSHCNRKHGGCSKSPPPSQAFLEEETVKEVLSETPAVPKHLPNHLLPKSQPNHQYPFIKAAPLLPHFSRTPDEKKHPTAAGIKTPPFNDEPSEDFSEICSNLSESVSVSASENRGNNGGENDGFQQIRHKSPARLKTRAFPGEAKRDKSVGRSPGRRPEPSPQRVRNGTNSGYGRRRDSGESSGRRSRSPVTRTDSGQPKTGLSRSQSTRKAGKSPGRLVPGSGERVRKMDEGKEMEENKWLPTSNESLENPLVSLECFIFL